MKTIAEKQKRKLSPIDVVTLLHSTLDIHEILENFIAYILQHYKFSGLKFEHEILKNKYTFGAVTKQFFIFNLSKNNTNLGAVTFYQNTPFHTEDIAFLEEQLCFLIQPLKNAICHYQVVQASLNDPLTNLLNRSSLNSTLQREMKLAQRHNTQLAIMILDIDNFKMINDVHGHLAGDAILIQVAEVINETIRETDIAFRIGGEEFLVLITDSDPLGTEKLAERLRMKMEQSFVKFENQNIQFTISLGVSYLQFKDSQNELIGRADKAMYAAKKAGKNQVVFS